MSPTRPGGIWVPPTPTAAVTGECLLHPDVGFDGYAIVRDDGLPHFAAVLYWEAQYGKRPERHLFRLLCGVRACVNPDHLRWAPAPWQVDMTPDVCSECGMNPRRRRDDGQRGRFCDACFGVLFAAIVAADRRRRRRGGAR